MNSFADEEVKLANCEVGGHEILLLVQITYTCLGGFLHNHLATDISFHYKQE